MQHLMNKYGKMDQNNIKQKKSKIYKLWDLSLPLENLISCSSTIQEYATNGRHPISEHEIVNAVYTVVFDTGVLFDNCNDLDDKYEGEKTWETFKFHHIDAKFWYKHCQRTTTKIGGLHGENTTQKSPMDI